MKSSGNSNGSASRRTRRRADTAQKPETMFEGLGVATGIAVGRAHVRETGAVEVPEYRITAEAVPAELKRFRKAVSRTRRQLRALQNKARALPPASAEEVSYLLDAHLRMLMGSRLLRGAERLIADENWNAEAAVQSVISGIAEGFAAMDDAYLSARMEDIREVGARLIRALLKSQRRPFGTLPKDSVLIAEELTPADTAVLDPRRIVAFATVLGGAEGHTAIMARALGLPAVLGTQGLLGGVKNGDMVVVDGRRGRVIVNPTPETLAEYEALRETIRRSQRQLARLRRLPSVTRDGVAIHLNANVELPRELDVVRQSGAAGVGLLRSEFLFMNREDLPSEDEQYRAVLDVIRSLEGLPVTVRTLDVGCDKLAYSLEKHLTIGPNPALGLRAIRLSLKLPKLLEVQLAAILRAGAHGPVRILLPMISMPSEVREVRALMQTVARRLKRRRVKIADPLPPLGAMIETPGAALSADSLAEAADFFAIGTNDLTMYALAIDRGDEQVAHLYNPLHPAVLRLIQFSIEAGTRAGIGVSICGEVAGDARFTPLLLGLGARDLSMAATNIARIKQRIRGIDLAEAARRARIIMEQSDMGRIATLLDDFNALAAT